MARAFAILLSSAAASASCAPKTQPPPAALTAPARSDAAAEPPACTKMDCDDQLTISLRARPGRRSAATGFTLELDGKRVTCTPRRKAAAPEDSHTCTGAATVAAARSQDGSTAITIVGAPTQVRMRLGAPTRAARAFAPKYADVRPNGPGCDPVCRQATEIWAR